MCFKRAVFNKTIAQLIKCMSMFLRQLMYWVCILPYQDSYLLNIKKPSLKNASLTMHGFVTFSAISSILICSAL